MEDKKMMMLEVLKKKNPRAEIMFLFLKLRLSKEKQPIRGE